MFYNLFEPCEGLGHATTSSLRTPSGILALLTPTSDHGNLGSTIGLVT